jgi:hypothetical protein
MKNEEQKVGKKLRPSSSSRAIIPVKMTAAAVKREALALKVA